MYFKLHWTPLILLALTGCVTVPQRPPPSTDPQDPATIQLAEAAASISQSLTRLSAIQQANTPAPSVCLPITCDCEMSNLVSVDWEGPIGPLIDRIGLMAHYRVRKLGNPPPIPVLVAITAHNTPLGEVLRDVAFQGGTRAEVVVYENKRIIELRYLRG